MLDSALDSALDWSVIGGYSKIGYALRSRSWDAGDLPRMDGKVVAVTGATSGLGLAAAEGFGRLGASVWLLARDARRGEQARAQVAAHATGGEIRLELCDLAQLSAVRDCASRLSQSVEHLDVLVNNAGVFADQRTLSADGVELTFAVNVLAPFVLTDQLLDVLRAGAPSRIINVSSGGMYARRLPADDLQFEDGGFDGATAYARTKRAEVILTEMWAPRLRDAGIVVHSMHPGWADTPGISSSLPRFYKLARPLLRSPREGADTIVWLGAADEPARSSGGFWHDRRRRPTYRLPRTRESAADRERLWAECLRLSDT